MALTIISRSMKGHLPGMLTQNGKELLQSAGMSHSPCDSQPLGGGPRETFENTDGSSLTKPGLCSQWMKGERSFPRILTSCLV